MTSVEKLQSTTNIFPIEAFHNDLDGTSCTEKEYKEVVKIWELCGGTFLGYHNFYLQKDVCLLAGVFQNFRRQSVKSYALDPAHYYSLPGLTFDAALKYSKKHLELIKDERIYGLIEDSIRGGVSFVGKRYSKANNPYMADFDSQKETSYNMYIDAVNLYGYGMCEPLPTGNFILVDSQNYREDFIYLSNIDNITLLNPTGKKCYFYNFDGYTPDEYHDYFSGFPLFAEKVEIPLDMYSEFQQKVYDEKEMRSGARLVTTLTPKKNYVAHFRMLQFALKHHFVITKVNSVIVCDQEPWLKTYIQKNTALRLQAAKAGDKFNVMIFKNMTNMFYGKTVKQIRNRSRVVIKSNDEAAQTMISKPTFKRSRILNDDLLLIETTIKNILLDKPIYIGAAVLDLAKLKMFSFHYDVMKSFYKDDQLSLLYTDTDSFIYNIKTENIYKDMLEPSMINEFDFSSYPSNALQFKDIPNFERVRQRNMKVLGKMKDELGEYIMD